MKPYERLPHRHPFIMLDSAELAEGEMHAQGTKQITINDPIILPDGTMPQVYIIEAMAQLSGIASRKNGISLFAGISGLNFHGTARAGDTLDLESRLERSMGALCVFNARASVSGKVIAEGGIVLHFEEHGE